ncbi:hypothetical protein Tco_0881710 [Tanacetum coccineum]
MGINVESAQVIQAAAKLGCLVLKCPFYYLGTRVGGSMTRVQAWQEIVEKVKSRLSKWKSKTLSIGGRLTLLKSVLGSIPVFHMSIFKVPSKVLHILESIRSHFFNGHDPGSKKASWVKWNNVLTDKKRGGLGVSSLFALNRGLMIKWVWKFLSQKDSLWTKVIVAIHGVGGKIHSEWTSTGKSCWLSILSEVRSLQRKAWQEIVEKVKSRLSKWKSKTLSIGGRLTLLKSVLGSIPVFHMSIFKVPSKVLHILESIRSHFFNGHDPGSKKASWVKWNNVLTDKKRGGLGVSSLFALNRGLMIKWVWKFLSQKDSLWTKVIVAIHGVGGKIHSEWTSTGKSCWLSILSEVRSLQRKGIFSVASVVDVSMSMPPNIEKNLDGKVCPDNNQRFLPGNQDDVYLPVNTF